MPYPKMDKELVQIGKINGKDYPRLTNKVILEIQKEATQNSRKQLQKKSGATTFNTPYLPDQEIPDKDKPRIVGKVSADFKTKGLDEGTFDWEGVFGKDSNGKPGKAKLVFRQWLNNKETEVFYELEVDKDGTYSWKDWQGQPARIPLYSKNLEPYTYSVYLDQDVSEKVKLLTYRIAGTPGSGGFEKDPETGLNVANIVIDLSIQQVASTKFVSEWHTDLKEDSRPPVEGEFDNKMDEYPGYFPFPTKDSESIIIRNDFINNSDYEDPGYSEYGSSSLVKTPEVKVTEGIEYADENDEEGTPTYSIDEDNKIITSLEDSLIKYKFKYDFTYDVIKGGKLTMTEILPVTFNANGGKFDSITGEDADQKIVKEVDYSKDLTDDVEIPKKDLETFKGWATEEKGKPLSEEDFKAAIKNIKKAKTFYAIWDNNEITAKELEVKESFKDGENWINDFIPTLADLKKQVTIADASGDPKALADDDKLEILNDSGNPIADGALKDALYEKLKEDDKTEVSRLVTLKAKVTHKNGSSQTVDIPIKVIKNIYEAKTKEGEPQYVPDGYVKVTVDPTTKAEKPQKYFYYVNPAAQVVIPGEDPTGAGNNQFTKWLIKGTTEEYKLSEKPRHKFTGETTIEAQYVSDVIPANSDGSKPDTAPKNFVEVKFVPTDKATDTAEKIFWVNPTKEVTIPVNNPVGKQYYTFKEWKIGDVKTGETYTVGTAKKFKTPTTITATYTEAKDIIPYNPQEPITRPDGYVRVTFEAEKGLELTQNKAYYVKKNAGITLKTIKDDTTNYGYPTYKEETGYKFKEWDKKDTPEITSDVVVTAKPEKLPTVVPEKDGNGTNEKPNGYKVVTFVIKDDDKTKGSIDGVAKFYVNPTEYVTINPPTIQANTGYEFGAWDQNTKIPAVYKDDTTITASFNGFSDVIPKTKNDDSEKPKGYVTVTFDIQGKNVGSKFLDGETTVYYVNPNKEVSLKIPAYKPAVGYQYSSISKDPTESQIYKQNTVITIYVKPLDKIIPAKDSNNQPNAKPDGYITVTFDKGDHGEITEGQTVYYINPKEETYLKEIDHPKVEANVGYKFDSWNFQDTYKLNGIDLIVTARYEPLPDIIPKTTNDDSEKPEGYITVTFSAEEDGKLTGTSVFYVNPNKAVALKDNAPKVTPNTGFDFAGWDTSIEREIKYKDKDVIKAKYNPIGAVIPKVDDNTKKPDGYVTVTFDKGANGKEITGTTVYFVDPNKQVTLQAPAVTPNTGWKQKDGTEAWDSALTQKFTDENTKITAQYTEVANVIPGDQAKPEGYVTVTFKPDENGTLSGTTSYHVNPNVEVNLTEQANGLAKNPNLGFTAEGGNWDKVLSGTFKQGETFTFKFKALDNVIPGGNNVDQPKGYVKVEFIAGENGRLEGGNKTYYVNPTKGIKVGSKDLPIPQTTPKNNYKFDKWLENIDQNEVITTDKKYVATFKINKVTMTYKAEDKTSGDVPEALSYDVGTKITLAGGVNLKKENYVLVAWSIGNKSYLPGAQYTITENTTATAVWDTDIHTVEFDTDGAGHIPSQKVKHNELITPVADPVKENHTFIGWKVDGQDFDPATAKVEKDITLVAQYVPNVVEQTNEDKPQVPEDFVKVIVKTTEDGVEKATEDTRFKRTFWVKKDTQVTITVPNPTGDTVKDAGGKPVTDVSGKEVKWNFIGWSSPLTASFTQETIITAKYDKTIPEPNIQADTVTTYVGKQPGLEDYKKALKAKLGEEGIDFATNVKETTVVTKPDVTKPGMSKARVQIEFNNGTTKTVEVPVKVNPNMYPADTDGGRTAETPANYVKVIVNPTILNADPQIKIYYVNPEADVAIPLPAINPQDGASFIEWYIDEGGKPAYNGEEHRFTEDPTMIVAKYNKAPIADYVLTEEGVQPKPEDYKKAITPPDGKEIQSLVIIEKPDVSKPGMKTAKVQVNYTDGTNAQIPVRVFVQRKPQTDWQTGTLGPTRTVTVVEKEIVKVPAEKTFRKEVRYMQGYNNYFRPGAGLTRAEAAQILANALVEDGYRYDPNFAIHYKDIVGNEWYAKAIRITSQANVFKGYDTGYFDPHKKITRAEWIGTLRRFQELERVSGNHMQVRADHWAMGEIEAAYKEGWLAIYGQGLAKFKADEFIPRQEVAAVSNKAFNRVLDKTYIHRNSKNLINYKDVNSSMWSYEDILCASNGFIHDGKSFWGHKVDYKKDLYNINLDGYTVTKDKFQRLERR
ncbi:hypothetical protein HMPREF9130_1052 [Peptoniphilus sp. oral taxon 375 str. F0436]|nr:hypothetical protein HMPREF9130_1052 [Peptoniphilus sp. oral taxon 375 str. F0436]